MQLPFLSIVPGHDAREGQTPEVVIGVGAIGMRSLSVVTYAIELSLRKSLFLNPSIFVETDPGTLSV